MKAHGNLAIKLLFNMQASTHKQWEIGLPSQPIKTN